MIRTVALAALVLAGCTPRELPAPDVTDAPGLYARARAEAPPAPLYAPFDAVVTLPGQRMALAGSLVVSAPDRFRVELRGPIGPAQIVVTCDGQDVRAWVAPKNRFYVAEDADRALGTLVSGGAELRGAAVATSLLLGRVPELGREPALSAAGPVATAVWTRDDQASFRVGIDGRTAHVVDARATDAAGAVLFTGAWRPGPATPTALQITLPTLDASADVRFGEWQAATPTDAAFRMEAPAGAELLPLPL